MLLPSKLLEAFVVAGISPNSLNEEQLLLDNQRILTNDHFQSSLKSRKSFITDLSFIDEESKNCRDPITDIIVVNQTNETLPDKFIPVIEYCFKNPSIHVKQKNSLNSSDGNISQHSTNNSTPFKRSDCVVCYKTGYDKPPITELGLLYAGRESPVNGVEVIYKTINGGSANLNSALLPNFSVFVTYRRIDRSLMFCCYDKPSSLCFIGMISGNQIEPHKLPPLLTKLNKNITKGSLSQTASFFIYRKTLIDKHRIIAEPEILDVFPTTNNIINHPKENSIGPKISAKQLSEFCLPYGAQIQLCDSSMISQSDPLNSANNTIRNRLFGCFVLGNLNTQKLYGFTLTTFESIENDKLNQVKTRLRDGVEFYLSNNEEILCYSRCFCLLTKFPLPEVMKCLLTMLYKYFDNNNSKITSECNHNAKKFLDHLFYDIPTLSTSCRNLYLYYERPINLMLSEELIRGGLQSIGNIGFLLNRIGVDNILTIFIHCLVESKILVHSYSSVLLAAAVESISRMIFPLYWQCAYIPLCPSTLMNMLCSPVPFLIGVNSQILTDIPLNDLSEVVCVDLDGCNIYWSSSNLNQNFNFKHQISNSSVSHSKDLPTKCLKLLRMRLVQINTEFQNVQSFKKPEQSLSKLRKELALRESFLQFMASILLQCRLNSINGRADKNNNFFSSSLDRSIDSFNENVNIYDCKFYNVLQTTQCFNRFLNESFSFPLAPRYQFFNEYLRRLNSSNNATVLFDSFNVSSGLFDLKALDKTSDFTTVVMIPSDFLSCKNEFITESSTELVKKGKSNYNVSLIGFDKTNFFQNTKHSRLFFNLNLIRCDQERTQERIFLSSLNSPHKSDYSEQCYLFVMFNYCQIFPILGMFLHLVQCANNYLKTETNLIYNPSIDLIRSLIQKSIQILQKLSLPSLTTSMKNLYVSLMSLCFEYKHFNLACLLFIISIDTEINSCLEFNNLFYNICNQEFRNPIRPNRKKRLFKSILHVSSACNHLLNLNRNLVKTNNSKSPTITNLNNNEASDFKSELSMYDIINAPVTEFNSLSSSSSSSSCIDDDNSNLKQPCENCFGAIVKSCRYCQMNKFQHIDAYKHMYYVYGIYWFC